MSTRAERVSIATVAREWGRIGVIGFGGPPAHIALFRSLCVDRRGWLSPQEFEDGVAATNLLPGPASTQLAIFCAWRIAGVRGAFVGGLAFICPGLVAIVTLAAVLLGPHPPIAVLGAAAGAGACVPAVAVAAARSLVPASWARVGVHRAARLRWVGYTLAGGIAAATIGPYLVAVIGACGVCEVVVRRPAGSTSSKGAVLAVVAHGRVLAAGGLASLAWVALKVGALSYGGGFVIVPLMQHDAVTVYHWMSPSQFLDAVALGQITPGPVVQTVAVVGYAAAGVGGAALAAVVAFAPSFVYVLALAPRFDRLRDSARARAFLTGAGASAIGAIAGAAVPLSRALSEVWQLPVLVVAAVWLLAWRRSTPVCLLGAGALGAAAVLLGAPVAH